MDIYESIYNWRLISIKTWISIDEYLLFTYIHCRTFLHRYHCLDINVDIHTCMDNWRLTSKNHGYPCWYPWNFGIHAWICYGFSDQGCPKDNYFSVDFVPYQINLDVILCKTKENLFKAGKSLYSVPGCLVTSPWPGALRLIHVVRSHKTFGQSHNASLARFHFSNFTKKAKST